MKLLTIVSILLFLCLPVLAQEEFVPPQTKALTHFSFVQLSGGITIVKAQIDSFPDSLNFVFDTGSGGISLDSMTALRLGIKTEMSTRTIRGIAGIKRVEFAYNHILKLPGLHVPNLDFHINDYELLTSVYGMKIDGIIGYSFLRRYVVAINNDTHVMEIYSPGILKYPRGGFLLKPDFSTLPLQPAIITDERQVLSRFIFDTGAGLNFLLSRDFVDDSLLFKADKRLYPTQAEGLGGKKRMDLTIVKEVKIGPYKFKRVPVHVFDDEFNVTSYPMLAGLIGNDLMRRFNLILNYPDRAIHLLPNRHFGDPFDYSYTGLGVYMVNNQVTVIDIIKNSPGDKAGFMPGDVIFSVDDNISRDIQAYKSLFQNTLGKVRVVLFRQGTLLLLHMRVKDIRR